MEPFRAETEESAEDLTGRKKSRLKVLKSRLFGRTKTGDREGDAKLSQSASDITAAEGGSEENLVCSQGGLSPRALSHDSIFQADEETLESDSTRVLSQENVHGKIKALQTRLQQQNMHLGPPPLVLPIRRPEDLGGSSEDDGPCRSPPEMSGGQGTFQGASHKATSQPSSRPLSPIPRPPPTRSMPPTPSASALLSALSSDAPLTSVAQALDFSSPAQFTPCLDTSAARHRMSVKPRNQRVGTKGKRLTTTSLETLNNIDHVMSEEEEEEDEEGQEVTVAEETHSQSKRSPELIAPMTPKSSSLTFSHGTAQQDQTLPGAAITALPASQIQASPQIPTDAVLSQQQSVPLQPDMKERSPGVFEMLATSLSKMDTRLNKTGETDKNPDIRKLKEESILYSRLPSTLASVVAFRTPSHSKNPEEGSSSQGKTDVSNTEAPLRQAAGQAENVSARGPQRPASASFSFSVTAAKVRDGERPRSGSFVGVVEQAGAQRKREGAEVNLPPPKTSQRGQELKTDKPKPFEPKGGPAPGAMRGQEGVEEALEAKEDQGDAGKMAFGVKLRSTSLSLKFQSDASTESKVKRHSAEMSSQTPPLAPHNPASKTLSSEEQRGAGQSSEGKGSAAIPSRKLPTNTSNTPATSGPLRQTGGAQPGPSTLPVKPNPPTVESAPKEARPALPQEPQTASQPAPQAAPSEVSWMSLAMMKTRTLQNLLTSRLPREFPSMQTATSPQGQAQPTKQEQSVAQTKTQKVTQSETPNVTQTQTAKPQQISPQLQTLSQPSTEAAKTPVAQTASSAQTSKSTPTLTTMQDRIATQPTGQLNISKFPQVESTKQAHNPPLQPSTSQPATQSSSAPISRPAAQTNPWATQSPVRSAPQRQTESTSSQLPAAQLPAWKSHSLRSATQPKATASTQASESTGAPSPASASASGTGEKAANQGKGAGPSVSDRRAAFLQKREESTTASGSKPVQVEVKKSRIETRPREELPAPPQTTPSNTDPVPVGRVGLKRPESSPTKVPGRLAEDKWTKKNMPSSSSLPSSSPLSSSPQQSISDGGQPSWMEMAKRKSMAWSDKTMD